MEFFDLSADLESQPITGWLRDGRKLNLPLISHVKDNLYVGGHSKHADLGDFFSHVFSFYIWEGKYVTGENTQHVECVMYDSDAVDEVSVENYSDAVVTALLSGGNVLVHCQAGVNRSNLVAARTLMKRYGMTPIEAIELLRKQRGEVVLANTAFETYLYNLS